jgi:hypothetical protein
MKKCYATLSEKSQRYYAAVEALKLGLGGQSHIARILGCGEKKIHRGLKELAELPDEPKYDSAIRKAGGGRNRYEEQHPNCFLTFKRRPPWGKINFRNEPTWTLQSPVNQDRRQGDEKGGRLRTDTESVSYRRTQHTAD